MKYTTQYLQTWLLVRLFGRPASVHRAHELPQSHPIHKATTRRRIPETRSIQQRYKKVQIISFRMQCIYERHSKLKEDSMSQGIGRVDSVQGERELQLGHEPNLPTSVFGHGLSNYSYLKGARSHIFPLAV